MGTAAAVVGGAIGIGGSLLSGRRASRASRSAEEAQIQAGLAAAQTQRQGETRGINTLRRSRASAQQNIQRAAGTAREDLDPFTQFGTGQIGSLEDILTSEGQLDFLENNPIFQAALRNANLGTDASSASQGRFRAGGTAQELFQNFLSTSFPILQSQTQNLFNAVNLGRGTAGQQSSQELQAGTNRANIIQQAGANIANVRTGAAANISNLQSGLGDVQAAGDINRANIFGNTVGQVAGFAGGIAGGAGGLPGIIERFTRNRAIQNANNAGPFPPLGMAPPAQFPGTAPRF